MRADAFAMRAAILPRADFLFVITLMLLMRAADDATR